jgi:hypoxanthine phosphoribosyltransferase
MNPFNEATEVSTTYEQVHSLAKQLYRSMAGDHAGPVVLIALGRGGWIPARLIAAEYEARNIHCITLSMVLAYTCIGTPSERPVVTQGLDCIAQSNLLRYVEGGHSVWIIDSLYSMGGTARVALDYLYQIVPSIISTKIKIGVLHWVTFNHSPRAPWRRCASSPPNAFGIKLESDLKVYVVYPWEMNL